MPFMPPTGNDPNDWLNYSQLANMESELNNLRFQQQQQRVRSSYNNSFEPYPMSNTTVVKAPSAFETKMVEEHFGWYIAIQVVKMILFVLFLLLLLYMFMPADVVPAFHATKIFEALDSTFIGGFRVWGQKIFSLFSVDGNTLQQYQDPTAELKNWIL